MRFSTAAVLALFLAGPLLGDELKTLSGKSVNGTLVSVGDAEIVLETKNDTVATPFAQVLALDLSAPNKATTANYSALRLIDDAVLQCSAIEFAGKEVQVTLTTGAKMKLPLSAVVWFVRDASNTVLRKQFDEVALQKARRDRIVILRDGRLNPLEGTLGEPDAAGKSVTFKREGAEPIPIQIDRLHAMIFYRTESPAEPAIVKVLDADGSMLAATKISYKKGEGWQLKTPFGADVSLAEGAVAKLDFNLGKLTYLSDLEPTKVLESRWGQTKDVIYPYRKDTNLAGEPIMLPERFAKGLSMHALTELTYDLGGKYKELRGILGVEARFGSTSQPIVEIWCDGEKRFSQTITAKETQKVNLNVKDVGALRIVVRSSSEIGVALGFGDHVTFADVRVSQ
jgi:NPCBM/NEW2 domain